MGIISNIRVDKPEVKPSKPSHVPGVHEGNEGGITWRERGHLSPGTGNEQRPGPASPRRSTGINPQARMPIDPRMPRLTPA